MAVYFKADVSDKAEIKKLNENVRKIGYVDILINNAGIVASSSVLAHTDHEIERIMDVNLMSNIKVRPNTFCDSQFRTAQAIPKRNFSKTQRANCQSS